jgi:AhpD family alkylhydroperoxidase
MLIDVITNQIFRHAAPQAIRHLAKPNLRTGEPLARDVLAQAAREFQMAPPVTIHSADPELMAGLWHATRETYVVGAGRRAKREAVAAAVSKLNACPYCVTVHAGLFAAAGHDARALERSDELPPDIAAAHTWAMASLSPGSAALRAPGIAAAEIPQIFGTAIVYHYINRIVSVFLVDTPVALPGMNSGIGRAIMHGSFALLGKSMIARDPEPGQCVIQREAALPPEFAWAASNPAVGRSLAHLAWAVENGGREAIPEAVRNMVERHLACWHGETAPMSRAWIEDLVAPLGEYHKPAARLALLAARAAYQVDDDLIAQFRTITPGDKPLLQTVAWASFAATKRIASWFPQSHIGSV